MNIKLCLLVRYKHLLKTVHRRLRYYKIVGFTIKTEGFVYNVWGNVCFQSTSMYRKENIFFAVMCQLR